MIFLFTWLLGLAVGVITTLINPVLRTVASVCTNLLYYQLTVTLALSGAISFIGHVFKSDLVAKKIGWAIGSPFQKELGFVQLGFAIAGVLSIWQGFSFWSSALVIATPFYLLAGINHLFEMIVKKNYHSHNTWTILPDLLMPLSWVVLYVLAAK